MAVDPRFNFVVSCPQTATRQTSGSNARKDFFNAVGKVGDIEILNRVGDGQVAAGLRTLASASNSIRDGSATSAIITNGVSGDANGANVVLSEVGINPQQAEKAGQFNPGVLNRATAEAESVYDRVKQGNYKLDDIPGSFQDLQNLKTLTDGIFTEGSTDQNKIELCGAKNYAQSLIQYAPKYKFMFVLQFTLKEEYKDWGTHANHMAFVVKNTGRPNINIEYEEVNFYNFWSRVPKRTVYEPITMRFHDDQKNGAAEFFQFYLKAISPIARMGGYRTSQVMNHEHLENVGLNGSRRDLDTSASIGALEGDHTAIIDTLSVFHLFDYGRLMSVYNYKNPKILSMNLDDLDMSEGASGNEIEFQFAYDALHITPALSVKTEADTLKTITGEPYTNNGYIEPVFPWGPDAQESAGGLEELPRTEEESLVERAGGAISSAVGDITTAFGSAVDSVTSAANNAVSSAIGTQASVQQVSNSVRDPIPATGFPASEARKLEQGGGNA